MGNFLSNILRGGSKTSKIRMASPIHKSIRPREEDIIGPAFRDTPTPAASKYRSPAVELPAPIAAKLNSTTAPTSPKFNSPMVEMPAPIARTSSRFADYGAKDRDLGRRAYRYLDPRGNNWKKALYGAVGLSFPAAALSDIVNSENEGDAMAEGIDDTFGTWFGSGTYDSARNLSGQSPADDSSIGRMMGMGEVFGRLPKLADGIASIPKAVMNPGRTLRNARGYVKGLTGMYGQGDIDKALASRQHVQGVYNRPQDVILEAAGNELRNGGTYRESMSGMVREQNLVSNALSKLNAGVPLNDSERQALAVRGYSVPGGYNNQTRLAQTRR